MPQRERGQQAPRRKEHHQPERRREQGAHHHGEDGTHKQCRPQHHRSQHDHREPHLDSPLSTSAGLATLLAVIVRRPPNDIGEGDQFVRRFRQHRELSTARRRRNAPRPGRGFMDQAAPQSERNPPWPPSPLTAPGTASARSPSCFTKPQPRCGATPTKRPRTLRFTTSVWVSTSRTPKPAPCCPTTTSCLRTSTRSPTSRTARRYSCSPKPKS